LTEGVSGGSKRTTGELRVRRKVAKVEFFNRMADAGAVGRAGSYGGRVGPEDSKHLGVFVCPGCMEYFVEVNDWRSESFKFFLEY
jgi:hypothetical protein